MSATEGTCSRLAPQRSASCTLVSWASVLGRVRERSAEPGLCRRDRPPRAVVKMRRGILWNRVCTPGPTALPRARWSGSVHCFFLTHTSRWSRDGIDAAPPARRARQIRTQLQASPERPLSLSLSLSLSRPQVACVRFGYDGAFFFFLISRPRFAMRVGISGPKCPTVRPSPTPNSSRGANVSVVRSFRRMETREGRVL